MKTDAHTDHWMQARHGPGTTVTLDFFSSMDFYEAGRNDRFRPSVAIKEWYADHNLELKWAFGEENVSFFFFPEGRESDALLFKMTFS